MNNLFDISINSMNLFSFMMGVSAVSLSGFYGGKTFWTRIAFMYIAGLAIFYGMVKNH
jgi:hypothetical protein